MLCRAQDLEALAGINFHLAEGCSEGILTFSEPVPHGDVKGKIRGQVMMTRIDLGTSIFVNASDIQPLNQEAIDCILDWNADIVFVAGPPLYLMSQTDPLRNTAWKNCLRLSDAVKPLIVEHHLMRDSQGPDWLNRISQKVGHPIFCGADFMKKRQRLLEAHRDEIYRRIPVSTTWH